MGSRARAGGGVNIWSTDRHAGRVGDAMLRAYLEAPVAPESTRTAMPGRWVAEAAYPSPNIQPQPLYLRPDRSLGERSREQQEFSIRSPQSHGQAAGEWMGAGCAGEHPTDQRLDDAGALACATPAARPGGAPLAPSPLRLRR